MIDDLLFPKIEHKRFITHWASQSERVINKSTSIQHPWRNQIAEGRPFMDTWIEELSADSFRYDIYQMLAHLALQYLSFHMQESNIRNRYRTGRNSLELRAPVVRNCCYHINENLMNKPLHNVNKVLSWQTRHEEHTFPSNCVPGEIKCLCNSCI